nr:hypothetical protein [uncultured Prevotella sp.]
MEKELNIAAILKDKPAGTKLWSPIFGNCVFSRLSGSGIRVFPIHNGFTSTEEKSFFVTGQYTLAGEVCLFPSKQMRDWHKFAWKNGDVLVNSRCLKILFDRWANDNYTSFYAKTINLVEDAFLDTNLHTLASEKEAKSFIRCIEEKFGGKLNLETLEIEKQTEFKDGDIVVLDGDSKSHYKTILLYQTNIDDEYEVYSFLNTGTSYLGLEATLMDDRKARLATDSEKQQLFSALEKEGKRWNPDTKTIEDLPKKCEFKPMDWCLMKDSTKYWELCQFAYTKKVHGTTIYSAVGGLIYYKCIPYNEETSHLLGTTDEWKGGEQ